MGRVKMVILNSRGTFHISQKSVTGLWLLSLWCRSYFSIFCFFPSCNPWVSGNLPHLGASLFLLSILPGWEFFAWPPVLSGKIGTLVSYLGKVLLSLRSYFSSLYPFSTASQVLAPNIAFQPESGIGLLCPILQSTQTRSSEEASHFLISHYTTNLLSHSNENSVVLA